MGSSVDGHRVAMGFGKDRKDGVSLGAACAECEVPSMEHTGAVPAAGASTTLCLQGMPPRFPLLQPCSPRVMSHHLRMRNSRAVGLTSSHPRPTAFPALSSFSPVPPAEQTHPGAISHPAGPPKAQHRPLLSRRGSSTGLKAAGSAREVGHCCPRIHCHRKAGTEMSHIPFVPSTRTLLQHFAAKFGRPGRVFDYLI